MIQKNFDCVFCGKPNPSKAQRKKHNAICDRNLKRSYSQEMAKRGREAYEKRMAYREMIKNECTG